MTFSKQAGGELYPYAECLTCVSEWPHGPTARDNAKHHGRSRGHKVRIVQETVAVWAPDDYDNTQDRQGREEL